MKNASACLVIAALVLTVGIAGPASAGSITYDLVDYPAYQNGYTLSGSITTDGTIGNLSAGDITAWTVTISSGAGSETFASTSGFGAGLDLVGSVVATSSQLYLPPRPTTGAADNELDLAGPSLPGFSRASGISWASHGGTASYQAAIDNSNTLAWVDNPPFGNANWNIATTSAVPEPSTMTMLAIAIVGLALFGRRTVASSVEKGTRPTEWRAAEAR